MSSNARWIPAVAVAALTLAAVPALLASVRAGSAASPDLPAVSSAVVPAVEVATVTNPSAEPEPVPEQSAAEERERIATHLRAKLEELRALLARADAWNSEAIGVAEFPSFDEQDPKARELEERSRQAMVDSARQEVQRMRRMFETGLVSRSQLADAETALAMAEAGTEERRLQETEIAVLKRQYEDAKRRYEMGLLSRDELARLEAEIVDLQRARMERPAMQASAELQKRTEMELAEHERRLARTRELYEKGLTSDAQVREQERVFKEFEKKDLEQKAARKAFEKELEQKYKLRMVTPDDPVKFAEAVTEAVPSRPIEVGDFLLVTIEGESQLPTIYRIESTGSIRVPLLGSFKVLAQTPGQVREAIGKRLLDAKLGSPAKVHVEIRRER